MPIYNFRCDKCGMVFEAMLKWDEQPHCPDEGCQCPEVTKLVTSPSTYLWNCDRGGSTAPKKHAGSQ